MIWNYKELFIRGIWVTLALTLVGYIGGIMLGLLIGLGKLSKKKWIYYPSKYYVDFFRGTPLLVQILLIHLAVIPTIFGQSLGYFVSGATALMLNCAAYNAEIIRAGIQSIDKGQMEAARSLGMPHKLAMRHIILPQALRRMIPPFGNELIALLKDSSLVTVIAANDLLYAGKIVAGAYNRFWEPYITVAVLYLFLTFLFTRVIAYTEKRFSNSYVPRQRRRMFTFGRPTGGSS
ncbi:amino acid ABC transporter permease [Compostibacillus humi]|jgi:glutamine transport system permease protein|uniref:Amino acid ABC transporter permease n=1 Tax=Compostibacillus humi TaxID=1245525 RepID=A0A8J2XAF1_9BACI|nr:amino acid ABC transporter permease [Compostibacillus humi]GFZ89931.1 amino acid ABC transporter permease [Compostibacillus humi]HLT55212.1 amino acid ABC transporter permease [Bacillota bacterium]